MGFLAERTPQRQRELLVAGTSALDVCTSVLRLLEQTAANKEGSKWLEELKGDMGRMIKKYQLRVSCNSARMRDKIEAGELPLTECLIQTYWNCGCHDVFIIFYPPMELLDGHWKDSLRLPVGGDFTGVSNPGYMAGLGNNPVQVFRTGRDLHWEFLRLWTGFELPSSCVDLP
jgi:hypothetical protein